MKKTVFITMLTAALLGGNAFANTGFEGGTMTPSGGVVSVNGNLRIFEDPDSPYEALAYAYGAKTSHDAFSQTVVMTGGTVLGVLHGGESTEDMCSACDNIVIVAGGRASIDIVGGFAAGQYYSSASGNQVYITGLSAGCTPNVIGGNAAGYDSVETINNKVHLVGEGAEIRIDNESYIGHAMTLGRVVGGTCSGKAYNNSIDIYGSGIHAKSMGHMQILNFHLVDGVATVKAPIVTLSGTDVPLNMANFSLGIIADDVTDLGLLAGRTVTLAETQLAIAGFGESSYKVVNVSKGGQADAAKALITLGAEGKELLLTVLSSSTELLAPGESRQAGSATITALSQTEPGLLDDLILGTDTISGQGRTASSASGLKIDSTADLLMEGMSLTANNKISVGGHTLTLKDVAITGDWTVAAGSRLNLRENSTITGGVTLEGGSTLDLGGATHSGNVSLGWDTTIGGGTLNGEISFAVENQQLALCGDLGGTGDIAIGVVNKNSSSPIGIDPPHPTFTSTLNLGGHTLTKGLKLVGDTTVSNGKLVLAHDMMVTLTETARTVTIGADTTVDLNERTFMHNLAIGENTSIGNGTIGGKVTVNDGRQVHFFGETRINSNNRFEDFLAYRGRIEVGGTTIQALHRPIQELQANGTQYYPGLLKDLTVSDGLIAGTDRHSSMATGLEIESTAALMIKGMTITADNKISVGQNTITLNDVTIKLSQTSYDIVDGVYYFTLSDLFHCSVDMADVTFDASDLSLPEGFNPETNGISFNLGDAKLTAETAERDIYLLLGGYGSRTMSIDEQGRPVFTKLVETPEPTTGTLSLLALAALAARRRK